MSRIFGDKGNYKAEHLKFRNESRDWIGRPLKQEQIQRGRKGITVMVLDDEKLDVKHVVEKFTPIDKYHIGSLFYVDTLMVILPMPLYYSSYEKMVLPFDMETWIYLILVFGIGLLAITIINRMPLWLQDSIFGQHVKSAEFNLIGTFFGIGQQKVPEYNTGRILMMVFIIFCLIIRTAYQGESLESKGIFLFLKYSRSFLRDVYHRCKEASTNYDNGT